MAAAAAFLAVLCHTSSVYENECVVNVWTHPNCVPWRPLACRTTKDGKRDVAYEPCAHLQERAGMLNIVSRVV